MHMLNIICRRSLYLLLVIALVVSLVACNQGKTTATTTAKPTATATTIITTTTTTTTTSAPKVYRLRLGMILTMSGPVGPAGSQVGYAMLDGIRYVNEIQNGIPFTDPKTGEKGLIMIDVTWEDTAYDTAKSAAAYERLAGKVDWIAGFGTGIALSLADKLSTDHLPYAALGASSAPTRASRWIITSTPGYNQQTAVWAKYFMQNWKESRKPRIGFMVLDSPTGAQVWEGNTKGYMESLGMEILPEEKIPPAATDMTIEIARLMRSNPDMVVIAASVAQVATVMRGAASLGVKDKTQWLTWDAGYDVGTLDKLAGAETEGLYAYSNSAITTETASGVVLANKYAKEWRSIENSNLYLLGWGWSQFQVLAIKRLADKVGFSGINKDSINEQFHNMSIVPADTGGLMGTAQTSYENNVVGQAIRIVQKVDHKSKLITDWFTYPAAIAAVTTK